MTCPGCGRSREPVAAECAFCGIVFAKSDRRTEHPLAPRPAPLPLRPKRRMPIQLVLVGVFVGAIGLLLVARWFVSGEPGQAPESAQAASTPSLEPAPEVEKDDPLEIFDPLLAEMNQTGSSYDIRFERRDVKFAYREGMRFTHPSRLPQYEKAARLSARRISEVTERDRDAMRAQQGATPYKCNVRGEWIYSAYLPQTADGVSECWARRRGNSIQGDVMIINTALGTWERYQWRPNFASWGRFNETESLRGWEYAIEKELGREAQQGDEDRGNKRIQDALSMENERHRKDALKSGIVRIYRTRLIRTAARARLEELRRSSSR